MKLSRRMEIYRDDIVFSRYKAELIAEAKIIEDSIQEMKDENKKLRKALHKACDNWTGECFKECKELNCMDIDVCKGEV